MSTTMFVPMLDDEQQQKQALRLEIITLKNHIFTFYCPLPR